MGSDALVTKQESAKQRAEEFDGLIQVWVCLEMEKKVEQKKGPGMWIVGFRAGRLQKWHLKENEKLLSTETYLYFYFFF